MLIIYIWTTIDVFPVCQYLLPSFVSEKPHQVVNTWAKLTCSSSFSNTLIKEALSISQTRGPGYAASPGRHPWLPSATACASRIRKDDASSHGFCYRQIIAQMHAAHVETQLQLKVKEKRVNWLGSLATLNALIEITNCSSRQQSSQRRCRNWHYQKAIRKNVYVFFFVFSWLYKFI